MIMISSALNLQKRHANPTGATRSNSFWGLATVVVALLILYSQLPLGTALQFGGDEGYELITGFLMSKGFLLYKQIWNDQPPLLVLWLSWAFKIWGPSLLAARLLAAGFGLVLFGTFFQLVSQRAGRWSAFLAVFFLVASPAILELSVSVMQEVPTFGTALVSALLLFRWCKGPHWGWLLASGIVMGVALEIKLTAMLVVPAMLVEIALTGQAVHNQSRRKIAALNAVQWAMPVGITFAVIGLIWGGGSFQSSYKSHFAEHPLYGMERPEDFPLPVSVFFDHAECVVAAAAGVVFAVRQRRLREFAFPLVMFLTALGVHAVHRPWWMYYYLHLAIPMAWLAGYAVSEIIKTFTRLFSKTETPQARRAAPREIAHPGLKLSSPKTWKGLVLCVFAALILVRSERRLEAGVENLQARIRADADPVLAKMKEYAGRTRWVYVQYGNETYPFHAQLPMPPEIAVVTLKRFWSDQISIKEIVETCRRYQVEQLLLKRTQPGEDWNELLQGYRVVYEGKDYVLYVATRISPQ